LLARDFSEENDSLFNSIDEIMRSKNAELLVELSNNYQSWLGKKRSQES